MIIAGILPICVSPRAYSDGRPTTSSAPDSSSTTQVIQENWSLLTSENTLQTRRLGAAKLIELGDPAVARLTDVLREQSSNPSAQIAVCEAIGASTNPPERLFAALTKKLGASPQQLSDAVVHAIQRYPAQQITESIAPIARDLESTLSRRLAAIDCLGEAFDDGRAIRVLAELVNDPSTAISTAAIANLSSAIGVDFAGPQAALAWWKQNENNSPAQWLAISMKARREQTRQARTEVNNLLRRIVTVSREAYLGTPEPQRDQKLLTLLKDDQPALRKLGLDLINDMITDRKEVSPDIKSELVDLITDPDIQVRTSAAKTASELRLNGAFRSLVTMLEKENNSDAKAAQLEALERLDDPSAIPIVIHFLDDQDPAVIGKTVLAIGSLSRAKAAGPIPRNGLSAVLLEKFRRLPPNCTELRMKFIQAMSRMTAPEYLPILRDEARRGDLKCRAAAITGLAAYGAELQSSDEIRACLSSSEPVIRQAAIEAIGKCGRSREDLAALAQGLSGKDDEENAGLETAWKSYLSICERLESEELFACANEYSGKPDKSAKQRCLDILRIIRNSNDRFEKLEPAGKVTLLKQIGQTQDQLGDYAAAAASFEQAAEACGKSADSKDLLLDCFRCRLKARKDSLVLDQLATCSNASANRDFPPCEKLAEIFFLELASRIELAEEARALEENQILIASSASMLEHNHAVQLKDIAAKCANRRIAVVDRLLSGLSNDPDAQAKLGAFKPNDVIPRIVDRIKTNTNALSKEELMKLIDLGRKLAPGWKGFDPNAENPAREKSLEDLKSAVSVRHVTSPNH